MNAYYNSEEFADQKLLLYDEHDEYLRTFQVHRIVWARHSSYFKSLFLRWKTEPSDNLRYTIETSENEAFELIIKYFYSDNLDVEILDSKSIQILYKCAVLGDKLGCSITNMLGSKLQNIPHGIDIDHFYQFYEEPLCITLLPVMTKIDEWVLEMFQDFDLIWRNRVLLQKFLHLPLNAMIFLLANDKVHATVESEDIVLMLVNKWINEGHGADYDKESCYQKVKDTIRYVELSDLFLMQVLPFMTWIPATWTQTVYLMHLKQYHRLNSFQPIPEKRIVNAFSILINTEKFQAWKNDNECILVPFECICHALVYTGRIHVLSEFFFIDFQIPRAYGTQIPVLHTVHGTIQLSVQIAGMKTIFSRNKFVVLNGQTVNSPEIFSNLKELQSNNIDFIHLNVRIN